MEIWYGYGMEIRIRYNVHGIISTFLTSTDIHQRFLYRGTYTFRDQHHAASRCGANSLAF